MSDPLVSIFIPAYNASSFIKQAIESVLAQSYPNYELIIINDASTDNTAEIINQYQTHPNIKVYHNIINLGVAPNWNYGLRFCKGEFIVRLNADDFFAPLYLEKVIALLQSCPKMDMVFTGVELIYDLYSRKTMTELPYKESWIRTGTEFLAQIVRLCHIRASSVCAKRSCYERLGGVINEMDIHEDWEMWVRITANSEVVGYIAEPLTYYRVLNPSGCTNLAIINARSPVACDIWLNKLATGKLPYQLTNKELALLKQGMYDIIMTFAVFAMENGLPDSVQKHLDFAQKLLPLSTYSTSRSIRARLYMRAAEVYFMNGGNHLKGWQFLLKSLSCGFPPLDTYRYLKLWARAFFGKTFFELVRENTVARRKFPYLGAS